MATVFILWLVVVVTVWISLRSSMMANHENLQAVGLIVLVWGMLFFGILTIPNFVPSPLNLYLALTDTIVAIVFSAIYFGYIKRTRQDFIITFTQEPESIRMRRIQVFFRSNDNETIEAQFFTMNVSIPAGHEDAEDVHFSYLHTDPPTPLQLDTIPSTGNPTLGVRWEGTREPFLSPVTRSDAFATAVMRAQE